MAEISSKELAQNIQLYREQGIGLDEIQASFYAKGLSEEEWEKALLLVRKSRIHEKGKKQKCFFLNVSSCIVLFMILGLLVFFGFFVYKEELINTFFLEESIEEETAIEVPILENENFEEMTEAERAAFEAGRYDMTTAGEKAPKVKIDKTKKILNDFELHIRDVDAVSKKEWETILDSIKNIPTTTINNNEIYIFEFKKKDNWRGFWIYKNKIILARPFSGKVADFFEKNEMKNVLINYKSDFLEHDFFFVDQFEIFTRMEEEEMEKRSEVRKDLRPIFEKMIDASKIGYFVDFIGIQKNKKNKEIEGYSVNFKNYSDESLVEIKIYPIELMASIKKMTKEELIEEMGKSRFLRRIRRQRVMDSSGTIMWPSGDYVLEIGSEYQDFIEAFLKKYKSDL